MGSTENGLFSRGCYIVFEDIDSPLACFGRMDNNQQKDLDSLFADFAVLADDYYKLHLGYEKIQVIFDKNQLMEIPNSSTIRID